MAKMNNTQTLKGWNFVLICSYAKDEPYVEVFKSAEFLPVNFTIFVTGNYKGKVNPKDVPLNVRLTGYLSETEYWALINKCQIVMDLTIKDDCLVCGAYEGIAAGKPLIISDTAASRELFRIGCVYVKSKAESITQGILKAVSEYNNNVIEISKLKIEMEHKWKSYLNVIREKSLY
jgi:glycosyltransferase involved in cell wall biosynthesis